MWLHVNVPPALLTSEAGTLIIHCVLLASGKWQFHADPLSLIARTAHATVKVAVKFNKTHTYADVHMYVSVYICIHIYYRKICLNLFFLETLQTSQSRTNFDVFPFACRAKVFHFFCFSLFINCIIGKFMKWRDNDDFNCAVSCRKKLTFPSHRIFCAISIPYSVPRNSRCLFALFDKLSGNYKWTRGQWLLGKRLERGWSENIYGNLKHNSKGGRTGEQRGSTFVCGRF